MLTAVIKIPRVRNWLKEEFPKPKIILDKPILAPPLTKNYGHVGTAFDYLFRFFVERNYEVSKTEWVAEIGVKRIGLFWLSKYETAKAMLNIAKRNYKRYQKYGKADYNLLKSCCLLAQLDVPVRRPALPEQFGIIDEGDIEDLRNLYELLLKVNFPEQKKIFLNPKFNGGSKLVGGADADCIFDSTLLEVKTTKEKSMQLDWYYQLIGYHLLACKFGITGYTLKGYRIKKYLIYFSRYGEFIEVCTETTSNHLIMKMLANEFCRVLSSHR